MGAVGPTPLLAPSADAYLTGRRLNRETVAETALLAAGDAKPIDDHRGGAAYRREMVAVLARRSLERCLNKYEQNGEMGI